eukprot:518558_1
MRIKIDKWILDNLKFQNNKRRSKLNLKCLCISIIFIQLLIITIYIYYIITDTPKTTDIEHSDIDIEELLLNREHSFTHETEYDYELADKLYPDHGNNDTIFIAIASYRDPECVQTILNVFETSKYPDRLRFGIFQQHNITDIDCMDFYRYIDCNINMNINSIDLQPKRHPICGRMWQIKIDREHFSDAKGPMYGRYRTELFYNNENYFMQIDAHSRMVPYWDNICIDMFVRTNNIRAVFTTYPKAVRFDNNWKPPVPQSNHDVVIIPQTKMLSHNFMFKHERGNDSPNPGKCVIAPFFAAGFSFQSGKRIIDVPSDPYLPYLFDGEEISMGIRMWTNGYDLYVPDRDIVYHIYSMKLRKGEKRHLFWELSPKEKYKKYAEFRILYLLKLFEKFKPNLTKYNIDLREMEKYNLGMERDINDFWKWIGMDFDKMESKHMRVRILKSELKRIPTISELVV